MPVKSYMLEINRGLKEYNGVNYKIPKNNPKITDENIARNAMAYIKALEDRPGQIEEELAAAKSEKVVLKFEAEELKAEKQEIMANMKTIVECSDNLKKMAHQFVDGTQAEALE